MSVCMPEIAYRIISCRSRASRLVPHLPTSCCTCVVRVYARVHREIYTQRVIEDIYSQGPSSPCIYLRRTSCPRIGRHLFALLGIF
jgi:hypothetical protein